MAEYIEITDTQVVGRTPDHEAELALEVDSDGDTRLLTLEIRDSDGDTLAECNIVGAQILQFFAAAERLRAEIGL